MIFVFEKNISKLFCKKRFLLYNFLMELKRIVVASGNQHKIDEIRQIFPDVNFVSMHDLGFNEEIEETGSTFKENACIKAEAVCKFLNLPTLADDSGLCVDMLDGAPGVYSARFSGRGEKANRDLLLRRMKDTDNRRAHFECVMCLCLPDGQKFYGEGRTYGKILTEETGENGFGYDCLFFSDDLEKSFAECSPEEKNSVSHRRRALEDLKKNLSLEETEE